MEGYRRLAGAFPSQVSRRITVLPWARAVSSQKAAIRLARPFPDWAGWMQRVWITPTSSRPAGMDQEILSYSGS